MKLQTLIFLFKFVAVQFLTDDNLSEVGITNADDRQKVLQAINMYSKQKSETIEVPSISTCEATAPPVDNTTYATSECVICMDQVVWIPINIALKDKFIYVKKFFFSVKLFMCLVVTSAVA